MLHHFVVEGCRASQVPYPQAQPIQEVDSLILNSVRQFAIVTTIVVIAFTIASIVTKAFVATLSVVNLLTKQIVIQMLNPQMAFGILQFALQEQPIVMEFKAIEQSIIAIEYFLSSKLDRKLNEFVILAVIEEFTNFKQFSDYAFIP